MYKKGINLNWGWDGKTVEGLGNECFEGVTFMQRPEGDGVAWACSV